MATTKNVTWQEYNGTDYDTLLPQPSIATADRAGGIIADSATWSQSPGYEAQYECEISRFTNKLLMPHNAFAPSAILNGAVPISLGGTNATTKEDALKNLGVYDYITSHSVVDGVETTIYKSGKIITLEKRFNSSPIGLSTLTSDGKWYRTNINTFTPSAAGVGTMNTWRYWNLQAITVGSVDSMPMFIEIQTGYDPTSYGIPWRLFSTTSQTFNVGRLLLICTVIV